MTVTSPLAWNSANVTCESNLNYQLAVASTNAEFSLLQSYLNDKLLSGSYWVLISNFNYPNWA